MRSAVLLILAFGIACGPQAKPTPTPDPTPSPFDPEGTSNFDKDFDFQTCMNGARYQEEWVRIRCECKEEQQRTAGLSEQWFLDCLRERSKEMRAADVDPPEKALAEVQRLEREVQKLTVQEPVSEGYDRKDWKHWIDEDKDCQDTRQEVLIEESELPVTFKPRPDKKQCKVLTGRWTCPYTGEVFTNPSKLDIDHMVPLRAAHSAGGHAWDTERKRAFANELGQPEHLIAVKAGAHRSKGKRGPDTWLPDVDSYRCEYVRTWVDIKVQWGLSVTSTERAVLDKFSSRCNVSPDFLKEHESHIRALCACKDRTCVEELDRATPDYMLAFYMDGFHELVGEDKKRFEALTDEGQKCGYRRRDKEFGEMIERIGAPGFDTSTGAK